MKKWTENNLEYHQWLPSVTMEEEVPEVCKTCDEECDEFEDTDRRISSWDLTVDDFHCGDGTEDDLECAYNHFDESYKWLQKKAAECAMKAGDAASK